MQYFFIGQLPFLIYIHILKICCFAQFGGAYFVRISLTELGRNSLPYFVRKHDLAFPYFVRLSEPSIYFARI